MGKTPNVNLSEIVKLNIRFMKCLGYFPPLDKTKLAKATFWVSALVFVVFFLMLSLLSETGDLVVSFGDVEQMSNASFLFLNHITQATKLYVLLTETTAVWRLIQSIDRTEFKPRNLMQYQHLSTVKRMAQRLTKMFLVMGSSTCILFGTFPLTEKREENEKLRLPLSGWYPFDSSKSPVFELIYLYRSVGALFNALASISMDTFLLGLLMVISGQLKILNIALEGLTGGEQKHLISSVRHYLHILQYSESLMHLFSKSIMARFLVNVIIICMTLFQLTLISVMSVQFLSMVFYQVCVTLEIFLWCYYGNEVIFESEQLTTSAYLSSWIDASKQYKMDLLLFMTRSQISLQLYAGGYFVLSLETFKALGRTSWSYFAVLNSTNE